MMDSSTEYTDIYFTIHPHIAYDSSSNNIFPSFSQYFSSVYSVYSVVTPFSLSFRYLAFRNCSDAVYVIFPQLIVSIEDLSDSAGPMF
ncbi:hypothetical protein KsCSTR_48760 [Candidatus Kuenenia stuttgartiensis]|uniref:Uncharacterized protein n=1 Tax=Kuenenia stuttgartiensis TaxID=174633 RepID=Q1PVK9_KUEST|nr:hypothetical protein KsCSTR_48760 [Candidatus Kuenenia stuttgartiensis]CAJ71268.1 unknown protein [Candidatus Kuenenia stuttgartiensis]